MDTSLKSLNSCRHLKEQFVSNLTGSSMLELFSLMTLLFSVTLLQHYVGSDAQTDAFSKKHEKENGIARTKHLGIYIVAVGLDFLCTVVPFVLFTTFSHAGSIRLDFNKYIYGCLIVAFMYFVSKFWIFSG